MPLSHFLEDWHDWRAPDGTASIAQPLVHPFFDTRTPAAILDLMIDPAARPGSFDAVRAQWTGLDDAAWRTAVASGVVPDSAAPLERVGTAGLVLPPIPPQTLTIDLRPSSQLYDGRFSTNAWAQECPDPITKEAWGSSARMHAGDMSRLGLKEGSLIRIDRGGSAILPVRAVSGQALGTVTLVTGYGREGTGQIADGLGASAWALGGNGTPHCGSGGRELGRDDTAGVRTRRRAGEAFSGSCSGGGDASRHAEALAAAQPAGPRQCAAAIRHGYRHRPVHWMQRLRDRLPGGEQRAGHRSR
ncbi:hypothetical protein ACFSHP_15000 [Novosphingobium panipatense]